MPGADDVHVGFVVGLAVIDALLVDEFLDLRHPQTLAGWAPLVRAMVAVGVVVSAVADHADLNHAVTHDAHTALGDISMLAYQQFSHRRSLSWQLPSGTRFPGPMLEFGMMACRRRRGNHECTKHQPYLYRALKSTIFRP